MLALCSDCLLFRTLRLKALLCARGIVIFFGDSHPLEVGNASLLFVRHAYNVFEAIYEFYSPDRRVFNIGPLRHGNK